VRQIKASEFKAKCLKLIDEVNETGDAIVITKHGKPVARVEREGRAKRSLSSLTGLLKGQITIVDPDDDLISGWTEADQKAWKRKLDRISKDVSPSQRKRSR
jgi:antitoxin (DNA-binding transcriptional repressor) of toxin-antitoxin stability system